MKSFFFLLAFLPLFLFSQTSEIEIELVKLRYERNEFPIEEYKKMGKEWQRLMDYFGGYPEFPLDKEGNKIEFQYIEQAPGLTKEQIFNRIIEYSAINFGSINEVLHYSNLGSGKLIFKGKFESYYLKRASGLFANPSNQTPTKFLVSFTVEFTLKDGAYKMRITDPLISDYYFYNYQETSSTLPITSYYPVTEAPLKEWDARLKKLIEIRNLFTYYSSSLKSYVNQISTDYDF